MMLVLFGENQKQDKLMVIEFIGVKLKEDHTLHNSVMLMLQCYIIIHV